MNDIQTYKSGMNDIDEPSPICAIRENPSLTDFPGHPCSIFYTSSCTMKCRYCHNQQLLSRHKCFTFHQLSDKIKTMRKSWIDAISITGGEPTMNENLPGTLQFIKSMKMKVKIDTNMSCPDTLSKCLPFLDYIAFDIKAPLDQYPYLCNFHDTSNIIKSLNLIANSNTPSEARMTLIQEYHTDDMIIQMTETALSANPSIIMLQPFIPHDDIPDSSFRSFRRCPMSFMQHAFSLVNHMHKNIKIR